MSIELRDISFSYPKSQSVLLRDFSLVLDAGTVTAFVGPSGSGKSTLLDILGGLRDPISGSVEEGGNPLSPHALRTKTSWILQSNAMMSGRSAIDNGSLALVAKGFSHEEATSLLRPLFEEFGLSHRMDQPIARLSGGEVQRVSIIRCLAADAQMILADEPSGQLDAANTVLVSDALRVAADRGKIVVIATHDREVAARANQLVDLRVASK